MRPVIHLKGYDRPSQLFVSERVYPAFFTSLLLKEDDGYGIAKDSSIATDHGDDSLGRRHYNDGSESGSSMRHQIML